MEELKADLERGRLEAAGPLLALELELQEAAAAGLASQEELVRRQSEVEALYDESFSEFLEGQVNIIERRGA